VGQHGAGRYIEDLYTGNRYPIIKTGFLILEAEHWYYTVKLATTVYLFVFSWRTVDSGREITRTQSFDTSVKNAVSSLPIPGILISSSKQDPAFPSKVAPDAIPIIIVDHYPEQETITDF
jgi:hypothetical protein